MSLPATGIKLTVEVCETRSYRGLLKDRLEDRESLCRPASTIADSSPMSPCSRGVSMQGNIRSGSDGIREIGADDLSAAAAVITEALLHDPGWLSVGPAGPGTGTSSPSATTVRR